MAAGSNRCESAGIPINCGTNRRFEEDDTDGASVERKWKALDALSAEYDHLGTTPPRTRIRNKEKHKCAVGEMLNSSASPKIVKFIRRNTTDNISIKNNISSIEVLENKRAKRRSLKTLRGHERDLKLDIEKCKEPQMEQISHHVGLSTITKLVESSNRFKSLHSQPVCHSSTRTSDKPADISTETSAVVDNRANFHSAFSMLIKMGNNDKNCKRTISMEEHTWQNELKDLIWLEVSARRAGRTATQQDAYLLSKRDIVPALLQNILDYKFVNTESKCHGSGVWATQISVTSPDSGIGNNLDDKNMFNNKCAETNNEYYSECLCVDCSVCSTAVGQAMREVETLLDLLSEAEALYPSTKAMAVQHPIIITDEFINKTKAMCLWYNIAHHQRLKMLIIKKLLYKHKWKFSQKKQEASLQNFSDCITQKSKSESKVKFSVEESDKNLAVECKNDNESDDDNDVKQASMIHIKITGAKLDSNASEDDTEQSSQDSTKSVDSQVQVEKSLLNVKSYNCKGESANIDDPPDTPNSEHSRSPYESADSSVGSLHSNESGFISVNENPEDSVIDINDFNVYNMGPLGDLTKLRLYDPNLISPYRDYIEKMLKVRGLRRALYFLEKLHLGVLKKTRMTLEKFKEEIVNVNESNENVEMESEVILRNYYNVDSSDDDFEYERHTRCEVDFQELKKECVELRRYGAWSKETRDMCLPSYRSIFLFLSTVPLENIHEFLLLRLETKPEKPSALSIKQLIYELREGLAIAVRLRSRFIRHVDTALVVEPKESKHRMFYEKVLSTFNNTLNEIYKLYLSYLSDWAGMEHLPRTILSNEWNFNYYLAQRLKSAATIAPLTFCCLTVRQLEGAADRLKKRVSELRQKTETFIKNESQNNSIKLCILRVCRDMQCLLSEERERALSTAQFAKIVSKHLDHNVVFREYRQKIYKAMACVQNILCWTIDQMQQATEPEKLIELDECDRPSVQSRTREIVSQGYKFGFEFHKEMCRLVNDDNIQEGSYNPYARNSISTYRKSVLTRTDSINLDNSQFSIDENYMFVPYTPTSNQEFTYSTYSTKPASRKPSRDEEALTYSLCGRKISSERKYSFRKDQKFNLTMNNKELANLKLEDFQTGIPGCESCNKLLVCEDLYSGMRKTFGTKDDDNCCDWEVLVSRGLVQFAKQWMDFAMKRCERGRGLRPRWANHGLEFLMLTCDPQHTKHLSDSEFEELKSMMDGCISHVIGSSRGVSATNNITSPTTVSTPPIQRVRTSSQNSQNPFSNRLLNSYTPPTPPLENNMHMYSYEIDVLRLKKKMSALKELDCKRDEALRKVGAIGTVRQGVGSRDHFRPRPVTFKWQRGIKIGQGRFGKVYTVVNTESGQLLAMKEVSLGIGDRRAIDRAANELQVLEGVVHPNLVRYYGVEIHREEMLIFMELCVEGSLESMIAGCSNTSDDGLNCDGLPEQLIRRYTSQLVSATKALHDRSIAHRDIKSGNIFLTDGGNCLKLGDFGCAVKIRANTTVPGELQGYIGTQAYMAPEVFMKSSGHGRAADIWSLGCVVVEMASGKHPWSEYDSNYQIMFVVGMGNRPEIPPSLSTEGTDFCLACLQHDPTERASAEKLSHHHFLKVNRTEYY